MNLLIVIILCLLGIILVLVEIFLIPGITITAVLGGIFILGGVYYAFSHLGVPEGIIALTATSIAIGAACVYLIKSKTLEVIALKTNIHSTVASGESLNISEGDEGITLSRLNPIGKVKVNNIVMEGKSWGGFIDEDAKITVIKVMPTQLIVKTK
jgi:membrane-bound ClpP family serine protease